MAEVVERAAWAKVEVVTADERERGATGGRITLNLGHTVAHALEAADGYENLLHGEAVAYGLRAATRIGTSMGVTPPERAARIEGLLDRLDLGRAPLPYPLDAVVAATGTDKKHAGGRLRWVLPTGDGVAVRDDVPATAVEAAVAQVLAGERAGVPASGRGRDGRSPMTRVLVLQGPNLNLLGTREPAIYGRETLEEIHAGIAGHAAELGLDVAFYQSNHEGDLIDRLQVRDFDVAIVNAAGYTHTSVALRDALLAIERPFWEVHLSDPWQRDAFRRVNFLHDIATASIVGQGARGYHLALEAIAARFGGAA